MRHLIIDRLGQIDEVLVTPRFFREQLADEIAAAPRLSRELFASALPAILLQGSLESATGEPQHRASNVSVLGVRAKFWQLGHGGPAKPPSGDEIVLNQPLAEQLHVKAGDEVLLRLPQANLVPADSPMGRKTETSRSRAIHGERHHCRRRIGAVWFAADATIAAGCIYGHRTAARLVDVAGACECNSCGGTR